MNMLRCATALLFCDFSGKPWLSTHDNIQLVTWKGGSLMANPRCKSRLVRKGNKPGPKPIKVKPHRRTKPVKPRCGK